MVLGEGPEPGRAAYEALPRDYAGQLLWEPKMVAAAADGTLACSSGPYRFLDGAGHETSTGVYFSVWRRSRVLGCLELVLDFGSRGSSFPESGPELSRLRAEKDSGAVRAFLEQCVRSGWCPATEGALYLGDPALETSRIPLGFLYSSAGDLGALWGRIDGTAGAFIAVFGWGSSGPVPLVFINA
jgi:hypothetical protein